MPAAQNIEVNLLGSSAFAGDWGAKKAKAIAQAVANWLPSVWVWSQSTGAIGSGPCVGALSLNMAQTKIVLSASFASSGWNGSSLPSYVDALAKGIATTPYTLNGTSPLVGAGAFIVSQVNAQASPLKATLASEYAKIGMVGPSTAQEIDALASAISSVFNSASLGTGAVLGAPAGVGATSQVPNLPLTIS